jgi:peroxiredoxin Q/BCP
VDPAETNRKFAESLELDYPILSDPEKGVARAYGVLSKLGFASRSTFYIGADGKILEVDRDVKASTAGEDVAARLEKLGIPRRQK